MLISFVFVSDFYEGERCCLVILGFIFIGVLYLFVIGLGYLVLRGDLLGRGFFVLNDVKIGGFK